jgi:hypothetical protein
MRNAFTIFDGKQEKRRPLERRRQKREDNNKMDIEDIGC